MSVMSMRCKNTPLDDIPGRYRLGEFIRRERLDRSLKEIANDIDRELNDDGSFTAVVIGEIERGARPASMQELKAISSVLGCQIDILANHLIAYHDSVWHVADEKLKFGDMQTKTTSVIGIDLVRALDELRVVGADLERGADALEEAEQVLWRIHQHVLSINLGHTAKLLRASFDRLNYLMSPERVNTMITHDEGTTEGKDRGGS